MLLAAAAAVAAEDDGGGVQKWDECVDSTRGLWDHVHRMEQQ